MSTTSASEVRERARTGSPGKTKTAIASAAGNCVENYDFHAYGMASALYFGKVFFPSADPTIGVLLALATFGVGFLARPIGGFIGGYLGDKYGRKPVMMASLIIMGTATAGIGLLPTYASVGLLAPALLIAVRIIQGLAYGAEWGGAVVMTYEHAPWRQRGFFSSIPQAGAPLGVALSSLTFLTSTALPGELAWRIPFLASLVLIVVGLIVRRTLEESPEFEDLKARKQVAKNPIGKVFREDWRNILRIIALRMAESCGYFVTVTYLMTYIKENGLAPSSTVLWGPILGSAIAVAGVMTVGRLTDKWGRRPIYLAACTFLMAYAFPVFALVNTGQSPIIIMAFIISIGLIWSCFAGVQSSWFTDLFNSSTRTSGASIGYQLSASISGFAPFIAAMLATQFGWMGPAGFVVAVGLIGLVGALSTRETWSQARRNEVDAFIEGQPSTIVRKDHDEVPVA